MGQRRNDERLLRAKVLGETTCPRVTLLTASPTLVKLVLGLGGYSCLSL